MEPCHDCAHVHLTQFHPTPYIIHRPRSRVPKNSVQLLENAGRNPGLKSPFRELIKRNSLN